MIYCLEDDSSIREMIIYTLQSYGMEAKGFDRPSAFWKAMENATPDLLLLDIMLPEEDGLSILARLRANHSTAQLPILMLTAKGSEYDKVVGLDSGADDYLAKPFGIMELLARIRALLRRTEKVSESKQQEYSVGALYLNAARHIVMDGNREVTLTNKEYNLLLLFLEHPGIVFTRDQLLNRIWGYSFDGESRTVDVHIRTLRTKLGSCGDLIETVRGIGYKFSEKPHSEFEN
ncbi:MAG: response regulator transcription factor [Clostridia bacterium]|nr:response regulator transcription factor [Clostridia bacterium]